MLKLFDRRARTAPSHYPRIPFHTLRAIQLLSSVVVAAIMTYFTYHLQRGHYAEPWTFLWLMAAAFFSFVALCFTIVLHCYIGLNPRINLAINSFLTLLWLVSWGLLSWYMRGTLANVCHIGLWKEEKGVMVCRIYKALFSFALFGTISTIGALVLDIYVFRSQTRRGAYHLHDLEPKPRPAATRGPFTEDPENINNNDVGSYAARGLDVERHESQPLDASPRPSMGPYSEQSEQHLLESEGAERGGFAVPEGQFDYDTGYQGVHKCTVE